jgi:signal transduction histidine kinase
MALDPAISRALPVAYRGDVGRLGGATSGLRAWLATPVGVRSGGRPGALGWLADLGIRPVDVLATAAVIGAVELNVATAGGPAQQPLNALAWSWGAAVGLPVLVRHRWPRGVLIACAVLLLLFYSTDRRDISPVPLLCLPLYDAAAAGFLALAIIIPAFYMTVGLFLVGQAQHAGALALAEEFLPSLVLLLLAILLGDAVRNRRALAAETAERLRLADEEREREGARRVAEERLRIARELHDTVAHSMATIAVQAASALHVLDTPPSAVTPGAATPGAVTPSAAAPGVRDALAAIRETSKGALADMRVTLSDLRTEDGEVEQAVTRTAGLARLDVLCEAVRAAGAPVSVTVRGEPAALPPEADHSAYRILQESLTNVLRHAGPDARADVVLCYDPDALTITITDNGGGPAGAPSAPAASPGETSAGRSSGFSEPSGHGGHGGHGGSGGHGLAGMAERVTALGGELAAGPRPGGGFQVTARLPLTPPAELAAARRPQAAGAS